MKLNYMSTLSSFLNYNPGAPLLAGLVGSLASPDCWREQEEDKRLMEDNPAVSLLSPTTLCSPATTGRFYWLHSLSSAMASEVGLRGGRGSDTFLGGSFYGLLRTIGRSCTKVFKQIDSPLPYEKPFLSTPPLLQLLAEMLL